MKTTSIEGSTFTARSMSTASVMEAVRQSRGWKVSTAHRMIPVAGSRSKRSLSSASSATLSSARSSVRIAIAIVVRLPRTRRRPR